MEPTSAEHIIKKNLDLVKQKVSPLPMSGPFEERSIEFPCEVDRYSAIVRLILAPWSLPLPQTSGSDWKERRCLEVEVCRPDRHLGTCSRVFSGTKKDIEDFLSNPKKAVSLILDLIKNNIVDLKRDEDEEWGKRHYPAP